MQAKRIRRLSGPRARGRPYGPYTRLAAILLIALLIIGVRLYYYTGPVFANTQDEMLYLSMYSGHVMSGAPVTFSQFASANFSNFSRCECNAANIFQFYVGLDYPEMLILGAFGYSGSLAIYYVILTSLVEGVFIFLILERIAGLRSAVVGGALFAFLPVDVIFSTHVQPLVPAMMAATIAVYFFIVASDTGRRLPYLAVGIFAGLAFLTNPIGAALLLFLLLALAVRALMHMRPSRLHDPALSRRAALGIVIVCIGFFSAYLPMGIVYLAEAGKFLLYPSMLHAVYAYMDATQPSPATYCLFGGVCMEYIELAPPYYVSILGDQPVSFMYLRYFGIAAYAFVALAAFGLVARKRNRWLAWFVILFAFYLIVIDFLPVNIVQGGGLKLYAPPEIAYVTTVFTLPLIVGSAIGLDVLFSRRRPVLVALAVIIIAAILMFDVIDLNHDVSFYRTSIVTVHEVIAYASTHPNETVYADPTFALAANLISGYRPTVRPLYNCSAAYVSALPGNSVIATGGMIGFDMPASTMGTFDSCIIPNLTEYTVQYNYSNPFDKYSPITEPPLVLYAKG